MPGSTSSLAADSSTFRLLSQRNLDRLDSDGGIALEDCQHFIAGSLEVDRSEKLLRFRHRGDQTLANQYRLLLMSVSETIIAPAHRTEPAGGP